VRILQGLKSFVLIQIRRFSEVRILKELEERHQDEPGCNRWFGGRAIENSRLMLAREVYYVNSIYGVVLSNGWRWMRFGANPSIYGGIRNAVVLAEARFAVHLLANVISLVRFARLSGGSLPADRRVLASVYKVDFPEPRFLDCWWEALLSTVIQRLRCSSRKLPALFQISTYRPIEMFCDSFWHGQNTRTSFMLTSDGHD
jgi:hypothetical protein